MCSNGTSSPHTAHTRLYLMRPPSLSCSWLNRRLFSSVAGNTRIGMETRPNEMAPFHMVLGMSEPPWKVPGREPDCTGRTSRYQHVRTRRGHFHPSLCWDPG